MSRSHPTDSTPLHRVSNREGYDRWASFYDAYPNPTVAADEEAFPRVWSRLRGVRVLEIGCGTGRHTSKLVEQGNEVVGIDASREMLRIARERVGEHRVTLICDDFVASTALEEASFDGAITSLVLEHIDDLDLVTRKIARVLRPGGQWFLSEIHPARTAKGTFAHFRDPSNGQDVHLTSYAHSAESIECAAARAGLALQATDDVLGSEALAGSRAGWEKYRGIPMVKTWVFRRTTSVVGDAK